MKNMKKLIFLACSTLILSSCNAHRQQSINETVMLALHDAAEKDNILAQVKLSQILSKQGKKEDALKWAKNAAEKGNAEAQFGVGFLLDEQKKHKEAIKFYKQAAHQEHPVALHNLGSFYSLGLGVKPDYKKAFNYYLNSAKLGHPNAQNKTAVRYIKGEGVKQNYKEAFYWLEKSAENKDVAGTYNLGKFYQDGYGVIDADIEKTIELWEWAASKEYLPAYNALAVLYERDSYVPRDLKKVEQWRKASLKLKRKYANRKAPYQDIDPLYSFKNYR